jgi:hypothetical protein
MAVHAQRYGDVRVSEHLAHHLRVNPAREEQRRRRMPQIVEANLGQTSPLEQWVILPQATVSLSCGSERTPTTPATPVTTVLTPAPTDWSEQQRTASRVEARKIQPCRTQVDGCEQQATSS